MKNVLLDTGVLLDYFQARMPFGLHALKIISALLQGEIKGFITPVILANCHYLLRKTHGEAATREKLLHLLQHLEVLSLEKSAVMNALQSDFADFEDALQHEAAVHSGKVEVILTRNIKDYKKAQLPVLTPEMFLLSHNA